MRESTPVFDDYEPPSFGGPVFADDLDDAIQSFMRRGTVPSEFTTPAPLGSRHVLLKPGTPHAAIAGVMEGCDELELMPVWDLSADGASLFHDTADDKLYRDPSEAGNLAIDVAETVGVLPAYYLGHNGGPNDADRRDVYLTQEPPRAIILTGSSTAPSGFRLYGGRLARLKGDPAGDADPWEAHPDSTEDVPLFAMTELAGMGDANYATGAVVLAVRRSFTKGGGRDAGNAWLIVGGGGGGASLPELEYQHMVYQAVTDNSIGGDFVRVHAPGV